MKSASEILKKAREDLGFSLEQVAEITKIRPEFLAKIEAGDYQSLPGEAYIKGFLRTFARAVQADEEKVLAFFRREYEENKKGSKRLTWQPIQIKIFNLTPTTFLAVMVSTLILSFLLFLAWQYKSFAGVPLLLIYEPTPQQLVTRSFVTVIGKSDPDAKVTINGEEVFLDKSGAFQKTIEVEPGIYQLKIAAVNKLGKKSEVTRTVEVRP